LTEKIFSASARMASRRMVNSRSLRLVLFMCLKQWLVLNGYSKTELPFTFFYGFVKIILRFLVNKNQILKNRGKYEI